MAILFFVLILFAGPLTFLVLGGAFLGATIKAVRYTDADDPGWVPPHWW